MNEYKAKGKIDQLKGEAKKQWGKLTDNHSKEDEGKFDKVKGKVKEGIGKLEDKLS
ncbi:CsbD family protein [Metabacillus fastidiosus]|uniref:CsbD family protein n=1 Tax=Metabacillus fastidiosus TaxID=1458 RepID=A0ABU6NWC0_9BACI|nr:CsbD family protein [Metabacillus fastidiosus]MED4400569.1 CsbD family protein [Metabacillus fastidiosus]MED4455794.1 CsbD family protein [Metabacillus fastidiosus]MED4464536.1 CsbD family protein [Metabacillus fastidiosus]